MGIELRLPQIQGSEKEQLVQIRSYLYQLTEQLQWALNNIDTVGGSGSGGYGGSGYLPYQQTNAITISNSVSAMNPEITFAKLKDLIIKSADIVEAYYDEINTRLEGHYVAQSDFGTFVEKTAQDIKQTSTYTDQVFSNVQAIINDIDGNIVTINGDIARVDGDISGINADIEIINGDIGGLNTAIGIANELVEGVKKSNDEANIKIGDLNKSIDGVNGEVTNLKASNDEINGKIGELNGIIDDVNSDIASLKVAIIEANAYIRSGELYKDANNIPVYGLEIGQRNLVNGVEVFNKYARFTSDRLSFFDKNDNEVAYISDRRLFIANAYITTSFVFGGFMDTVTENGGIITKWVGGNG